MGMFLNRGDIKEEFSGNNYIAKAGLKDRDQVKNSTSNLFGSLFLFLLISHYSSLCFSETIRIATYNVKYLSACLNSVREASFRETIKSLNADVLAIQEVRDRRALEYFFDPEEWISIIDDESTDDQNLAFVVRNSVNYRLASGSDNNVELSDFLFPDSSNFPDKRDVLRIYINLPELNGEIEVLNHHAKSRYNGRITSEAKRLGAAVELVNYINASSNDHIILLGDFNDTPDDASLNTVETGQLSVLSMENDEGSFLINLAEKKIALDYVSYGLNTRNIKDGVTVPIVEGSRTDNYEGYNDDYEVRKALYDQILVTPTLVTNLNHPEFMVFDGSIAVSGNSDTRSSDHVPVYIDLFPVSDVASGITVTNVLPDPVGSDRNNEEVVLTSSLPYAFQGQLLFVDQSGNSYSIDVRIEPNSIITVTPSETSFSLNNSGDSVSVFYQDNLIQAIQYPSVDEGERVYFN